MAALRAHTFDLVYDLQHVDRTRFYGKFLKYKGWAGHGDHGRHPQLRFGDLLGKMPAVDLRAIAEPFQPLKKGITPVMLLMTKSWRDWPWRRLLKRKSQDLNF